MKASEANVLAFQNNNGQRLLKTALPKIKKAAEKGKFELKIEVGDSTDSYNLEKALNKLGYKVETSSQQCSPNDSYYFLHISWEDYNEN